MILFNFEKIKNDNRGFTIVEVLTSVFVFSVIIVAIGGIFTQVMVLQRRGTGAQKVQENTLFALELMAREIRVSTITNQNAVNCDRATLTIVHPVNGTVTYSLSNGLIQRTVSGVATTITSNDVNFTRLNFCVQGTTVTGGITGDQLQARIGIIIQASSRLAQPQDVVVFDMQTTVVSRDNAIEFTD